MSNGTGPPSSSKTLTDHRARNLFNQRAHRNRRRQYVAELEAQVHAYERAEIHATKQVQDAARMVVRENEVLKDLVERSLGWRRAEVDVWVGEQVGRRTSAFKSWGDGSIQTDPGAQPRPRPCETVTLKPDDHNTVPDTSASTSLPIQASPLCHSSNPSPYAPSQSPAAPSSGKTCAAPKPDSKLASRTHAAESTSKSNDDAPATVSPGETAMSCEAAASIITSLRHSADDNLRDRLGCNPESNANCEVRSVDVFGMLEEYM